MRTRNHSKQQQQSSDRKEGTMKPSNDSESQNSCLESTNDSGTLTDISRDNVGKLLKRVKSRGLRGSKKEDNDINLGNYLGKIRTVPKKDGKQVSGTQSTQHASETEHCKDAIENTPSEEIVKGRSFEHSNSEREDEMDDLDWEIGSIPSSSYMDNPQEDKIKRMVIEFDAQPDSTKWKPIRRASAKDKELAELVHKVHLLCLLGRGRLIDNACNDPLIQASLLSLLPAHLLKLAEVDKLTAKALDPLVSWFHNRFQIKSPSNIERQFNSALAYALENYEGTTEEVAALFVALLRALNFTTRFVSILDVASLKPDADKSESINQHLCRTGRNIFNSSTLMVDRSNQVSVSPFRKRIPDMNNNVSESSQKGACSTSTSKPQSGSSSVHVQLSDKTSDSLVFEAQNDVSHLHLLNKDESLKRKGDIEFEMQLEMAFSATAIDSSKSNMGSNVGNVHSDCSILSSPPKRLKKGQMDQSSSSSHNISTAIGSRKVGAPLFWAEVYFSGENLTGKWVHVDVVNAIINGEEKVEAAAAACRISLRYVVAFAGHGAKDVTRRYCMKWYKIASQRIDSMWWDSVLAPLKELESGSTGGMVHLNQEALDKPEKLKVPSGILSCEIQDYNDFPEKSTMALKEYSDRSSVVSNWTSLEDMELETRALTEPLPTNQQAYRNHPLYAIERWLTKYQILHPKGPVLGFCSGHAVYPRTCVQILHTKERWLREGLQIRANELPTKVVKRSHKVSKEQAYEGDVCGDGVLEGTIMLYGKWQTEPLCLPHAVNGIVPKNERGQVDVWSEKCLPPGTVHLRLPRLAPVAKRLEIDYAPAMVGFDFRNGRSVPLFEGIVVCAEVKDAILEAYMEEEEIRETAQKKRNEREALSRWYQLLSSIVTRQRLNNCYGDGALLQASTYIQREDDKCHTSMAVNEDDKYSPQCQQKAIDDIKQDASQSELVPTGHHEHVFFMADENLDNESSTRIKRCHCGFSIEVEEF